MSTSYPPLDPCEKHLTGTDELLYRQITIHQWNETARIPAAHAFGPKDADKGRPSFAHAGTEGVDEQSSRDWHQKNARTPSLGVWATSVSEVDSVNLRAVYDGDCPLEPGDKRAPGHTYVDYRGVARKDLKDARAELLLLALERGELPTTDCLQSEVEDAEQSDEDASTVSSDINDTEKASGTGQEAD